MAGCRNSVNQICDDLGKMLKLAIPCFPKIPPYLEAFGASSRKGLDKKLIASRIISRFSQIGLMNGPDRAGNQNVMEAFAALIVDEIIDAICFEARVTVGLQPMSVQGTGTGGNAGGPIVVNVMAPLMATSFNGSIS